MTKPFAPTMSLYGLAITIPGHSMRQGTVKWKGRSGRVWTFTRNQPKSRHELVFQTEEEFITAQEDIIHGRHWPQTAQRVFHVIPVSEEEAKAAWSVKARDARIQIEKIMEQALRCGKKLDEVPQVIDYFGLDTEDAVRDDFEELANEITQRVEADWERKLARIQGLLTAEAANLGVEPKDLFGMPSVITRIKTQLAGERINLYETIERMKAKEEAEELTQTVEGISVADEEGEEVILVDSGERENDPDPNHESTEQATESPSSPETGSGEEDESDECILPGNEEEANGGEIEEASQE